MVKILKERALIRNELKKKNIETCWDPNRNKIILYIPYSPGRSSVEVGYMTSDNKVVFN